MKRGTMTAFLGAAALTAVLAVATPAYAATVTQACPTGDAGVSGSTEGNGQITYLSGAGFGSCGTLGLRVNYTHVGGSSWTAWTYSPSNGAYTSQNVGNSAHHSQHTATTGSLNFMSYR